MVQIPTRGSPRVCSTYPQRGPDIIYMYICWVQNFVFRHFLGVWRLCGYFWLLLKSKFCFKVWSKESNLQYFRPSLSCHLPLRSLFCLFLSGLFRQVLLYLVSYLFPTKILTGNCVKWWHTKQEVTLTFRVFWGIRDIYIYIYGAGCNGIAD